MAHPPGRDGSTATAHASGADPAVVERMDAAARTASALAHQFANYLGTMRAMIELLAERVQADREAVQDLAVLEQSASGATRFLDSLRAFTHPPALGGATSDLNAVLREAEPALRTRVGPDAQLTLRIAGGALAVRGDPDRLRALVLDLAAALAGDGSRRGDLMIESGAATGGPATPSVADLVVHSDGRGFDAAQAARVFEPFVFDASYDGGLRLPAIYATVLSSGGRMAATASLAGGVTIRVALPRPAPPAAGRKEPG